MPDKTTLPGRQTTTDGPVHIREVVAELLAWRGIDPHRRPDRPATRPALYAPQQAMVAIPAGCR